MESTMAPARKEPDVSTYSGLVSQRIRELREKKNLTTDDVARLIAEAGFSTTSSNIRHWENGTSRPNLDAMPYLAAVLGVRVSQCFPDMPIDRKR